MKIEFPYLIKKGEFEEILGIYLWVKIKTKIGIYRSQKFLFDTGADFTSLPRFLSGVVGIDLAKCRQEIMYTANNEAMVTFRGKIVINLNSKDLELPCVFTEKDDTPFLLGKTGIIDRFDILLSAKKKKIILERIE